MNESEIKRVSKWKGDVRSITIYDRILDNDSYKSLKKSSGRSRYLIFRYLGNGLCEEYYSKKVTRVSSICHYNNKSLVREYHELKNYPLSVSYRDISKINTEDKKSMVFEGIYQDKNNIENIVVLNEAEESSRQNLDAHAKHIAEEVYAEAYGANEVYNFKKKLK